MKETCYVRVCVQNIDGKCVVDPCPCLSANVKNKIELAESCKDTIKHTADHAQNFSFSKEFEGY